MLRARLANASPSLGLSVLCVLAWCQVVLGQEVPPTSRTRQPAPRDPVELPNDIEQVLWWLPEETESVVVSRGDVPLKKLKSFLPSADAADAAGAAPSWAPPPTYVYPAYDYPYQDLVAMHCIEPLVYHTGLCDDDLRNSMVNSYYNPKAASLFVKAAWWEEDQSWASCDIVIFRANTASQIIKSFASLPHEHGSSRGIHVLKVDLNHGISPEAREGHHERPTKADWRYLAAPWPHVYVCTTARPLMTVILERMRQRGKNRALPANLPE